MLIGIASDHAGYYYKKTLKHYIDSRVPFCGYVGIFDYGPYEYNKDDDYSFYAEIACNGYADRTILICGTGIGMSMCANRRHHIRAARCTSVEDAILCRKHNNANVLCLGSGSTSIEVAENMIDKFLTTPFSGEERHIRRLESFSSMI